MRRLIAALCTVTALGTLTACSELFGVGYSIEGNRVHYASGFPVVKREVMDADAATFQDLDGTYAKDKSRVYYAGTELTGADVSSFEVLGRGFVKDRSHVWLSGQRISNDPINFELLQGELAKDSAAVYCHNGSVLSNDAGNFVRVSKTDNILGYTKDSRAVYYYCSPIPGADPNTFRVLNDNMHCAADQQHAYHASSVIPNTDPRNFPVGKPVTGCSDTSITFAT